MKVGYPDTLNSMYYPPKSPLFHKGHGKDKIEDHHGSYDDGDLIDETDFEKAGSELNVQDVNAIQSDKISQFIVNKTGEDSPFVNPKRQDTIRPLKGNKKFMRGYEMSKLKN